MSTPPTPSQPALPRAHTAAGRGRKKTIAHAEGKSPTPLPPTLLRARTAAGRGLKTTHASRPRQLRPTPPLPTRR